MPTPASPASPAPERRPGASPGDVLATGGRADRPAVAPAAFARNLALLVVVALLLRAGAVMLLHRLDPARGYAWDSFFAALPGALAGIVLGSRTPRRPHAAWRTVALVGLVVAGAHLLLSLAMARRTGFTRPPPDGLTSLAIAALVAGVAVPLGAWLGRRVTRVGERLEGRTGDA